MPLYRRRRSGLVIVPVQVLLVVPLLDEPLSRRPRHRFGSKTHTPFFLASTTLGTSMSTLAPNEAQVRGCYRTPNVTLA